MTNKRTGDRSGRRVHPKSIEKRQRILDAAAKALAENGDSNTRLSDIARDAGTHAGSLYYYFPSREDLVQEVLASAVERLPDPADSLAEDNAHLSPLDQLLGLVRAAIDQLTSMGHDYYLRAYLRNYDQVPEEIRSELKRRRRHLRRTLIDLMRQAQARGEITPDLDPAISAHFIIGATNWVGLWYNPRGSTPAETISDTFAALVQHGLQGLPPSRTKNRPTGTRRTGRE